MTLPPPVTHPVQPGDSSPASDGSIRPPECAGSGGNISVASNPQELDEVALLLGCLKSVRDGLITFWTTIAVVATFSAAVEVTLLTGNPAPVPSTQSLRGTLAAKQFYLFATYTAMICAIAATLGSLALVGAMAIADWNRAFKAAATASKASLEQKKTQEIFLSIIPPDDRLRMEALIHYTINFIVFGMTFMVAQILAYIWLHESDMLAAILTVVVSIVIIAHPNMLLFLEYYGAPPGTASMFLRSPFIVTVLLPQGPSHS